MENRYCLHYEVVSIAMSNTVLRDLSSKGSHEFVGCDWLAKNKRRRLVETPKNILNLVHDSILI